MHVFYINAAAGIRAKGSCPTTVLIFLWDTNPGSTWVCFCPCAVLWVVASRSLVEIYHSFRGPCYHHQVDELSPRWWRRKPLTSQNLSCRSKSKTISDNSCSGWNCYAILFRKTCVHTFTHWRTMCGVHMRSNLTLLSSIRYPWIDT